MDQLTKAITEKDAEGTSDALTTLSAAFTDNGKWTGEGAPPVAVDDVKAALQMPEATPAALVLLRKLLKADDASTVFNTRLPLLESLLRHKDEEARRLALDILSDAIERDAANAERWQPIVIQAATAVGDDETEVAYAALRLLKSLAAHPAGLAVLFSEGVLGALQQQSAKNETVELRVQELFVQLGAENPQTLTEIAEKKVLKPLLDSLTTPREDVLWNLNALELLKVLLVTPHGYIYLSDFNVMDYLAAFVGQLASGEVDPTVASLLAPAVLEALGSVWNVKDVDYKELEEKLPFATALSALVVQNANMGGKHAAMSALFDICSNASGMRLMRSHRPALTSLGSFGAAGGNPELQTHIIAGVGATLARQTSDTALAEEYFAFYAVEGRPLDARLMELLASPFQELQLAAFDFARGLAHHVWGQKRLMQQPGFLEFVTGSGGGPTYKIRLARFELAKVMAAADDSVLDAPQRMKFKRVVRDGPFASNAEPGVAIGTEDA